MAIIKNQGTSGKVHDNIDGTTKLRKSVVDFSQLLTFEGGGCLNFSDFFYFLDNPLAAH